MWYLFGLILLILLVLMVYERFCFFIEKFDRDVHT
jgi:hypothetical protein